MHEASLGAHVLANIIPLGNALRFSCALHMTLVQPTAEWCSLGAVRRFLP